MKEIHLPMTADEAGRALMELECCHPDCKNKAVWTRPDRSGKIIRGVCEDHQSYNREEGGDR
jgi:hypothetical protein